MRSSIRVATRCIVSSSSIGEVRSARAVIGPSPLMEGGFFVS